MLKFRRWLGVEQSIYDHAYLRISTDGSDRTTIWENTGEITDSSWSLHEYDISPVADGQPTVYLQWTMGPTDGGWRYCGWNIDDVEIWGFVTCHDGVLNQGEERVDCGGPCAPCECTSDGACVDGLFCNGDETCDAFGHCQAGAAPCPPVLCNEDTDTCASCQNNDECDDELYCNGVETCDAFGVCQAGAAVNCDDDVECTVDSCNEAAESCDNVPSDALCDDVNVCTVDSCDLELGCVHDGTGITSPCDDGNACTVDDICQGDPAGTCTGRVANPPEHGEGITVKNRYISFADANPETATAIRVTFVDLPAPYEEFEGRTMWVAKPYEYCENAGQAWPPEGGCGDAPGLESNTFVAATLQCEPHFTNWSAYGTVHTYHMLIIPGAVYQIQAVDWNCSPDLESSFSSPLELVTSRWGDLVKDCSTNPCGAPDGDVNIPFDVTAVIEKFMNRSGAPINARTDLEPATPDQKINMSDATHCIDAFRGLAYPFPPGPDPCP
jgi:hypothetical protein